MDTTTTIFLVLVGLVVVLVVVFGALALFGGSAEQREQEEDRRHRAEEREGRERTGRREFYKTLGHEQGRELKLRLFSLEQYGEEVGGDAEAARSRGFIAAFKTSQLVDDEWYDLPPERAGRLMDLAPEDYEADDRHGILLVRKLPPGLPSEARDLI